MNAGVALVTGSGRGIGRAIAQRLAADGATIALCARSVDQLEAVAAEIPSATLVVPGDIAGDGEPTRIVAQVEAALGPIDVLVNAAGISPVYTRAEQTSIEDWDAIMSVNVRAAFLLCQAAGIGMLERQRGSIVNVASVGGVVALPRLVAYCAAKGALVAMTRVMAVEWADRGVRVNVVAPAYVETELSSGLTTHARVGPQLLAATPLGRFGEATEIASAVAFLASQESSYVTGTTLAVDGGWTAQ